MAYNGLLFKKTSEFISEISFPTGVEIHKKQGVIGSCFALPAASRE